MSRIKLTEKDLINLIRSASKGLNEQGQEKWTCDNGVCKKVCGKCGPGEFATEQECEDSNCEERARPGGYRGRDDSMSALDTQALNEVIKRTLNETQLLLNEAQKPCDGPHDTSSFCTDCCNHAQDFENTFGEGTAGSGCGNGTGVGGCYSSIRIKGDRMAYDGSDFEARLSAPCTGEQVEDGCYDGVSGDCVCEGDPTSRRMSENELRRIVNRVINETQLLTEEVPCPIKDNCCHVGSDHNVYWGCPEGETCDGVNHGNGGGECSGSVVDDRGRDEWRDGDKFSTTSKAPCCPPTKIGGNCCKPKPNSGKTVRGSASSRREMREGPNPNACPPVSCQNAPYMVQAPSTHPTQPCKCVRASSLQRKRPTTNKIKNTRNR